MKNILKLLFLIVFVLDFKTVLGQKKQHRVLYGVYLGGNISKFNPLDLSKKLSFGDTYKWNSSYNFGANIDFVVSNLLYFESGLNFISKKSNALPKELFTKTFYNYANGNTSISNMTYMGEFGDKSLALQIPLSLHLNIFQKGSFKSNFYGGILWENMFEHSLKSKFNSQWTPNNPPAEAIKESEISKELFFKNNPNIENSLGFRKSNVGVVVGVGFSLNKVGLDVNFNSSDRVYNSVQYKIPSICFNLRYQII